MRNLGSASMLFTIHLLGCLGNVYSQNIPPLTGDQVGKPKISIANPLSQQGQQRDASNQSYSASPQDTEIHDFLNAFVKSVAEKDLEKIAACYSQQPAPVVYWDSLEFRGWEAIQAQWQKILSEKGGIKLALSDLDIHVFGRFAWVTARYQRASREEGKLYGHEGYITFVLEKKRAQWLILHEHVSQGLTS